MTGKECFDLLWDTLIELRLSNKRETYLEYCLKASEDDVKFFEAFGAKLELKEEKKNERTTVVFENGSKLVVPKDTKERTRLKTTKGILINDL